MKSWNPKISIEVLEFKQIGETDKRDKGLFGGIFFYFRRNNLTKGMIMPYIL